MTSLIIDSNLARAQRIDRYIRSMPAFQHRGILEDVGNTLSFMESGLFTLDLVFLDASFWSEPVLEFVLKLKSRTLFIITSDQEEDMAKAFQCEAISFLLQPVSLEDFTIAAQKAILHWNNRHPDHTYFYIRDANKGRKIRVEVSKIAYLETMSNYVKLYYSDGVHDLVYLSLHKLLEKLPQGLFLRIGQCIAVPLVAILSYDKEMVYLRGEKTFQIGKSYKKRVFAVLSKREIK